MKLINIFVVLIFSIGAYAEVPSFVPFQKVLDQYLVEVKHPDGGFETHFKYQKMYADSSARKNMDEQLKIIEAFSVDKLKTKDEAMAFWINTYNTFMVAKILKDGFNADQLKINSVKDLGSLFSPYKAFTTKDFKVGRQLMALDEIEKQTLLGTEYKAKGWKDARVHFAVNCASVGCPPLIKTVYKPEDINHVLDENIKSALKTKRHFNISGDDVNVTHLAKWYKDDFVEQFGSVAQFLTKYLSDEPAKKKVAADKFKYIAYDWNLNKPENF